MLVMLLLCLLLLFIFLTNTQSPKKETGTMQQNSESEIINANFKNDPAKWIYYACIKEGFSPLVAGFVVAQCAYETGDFCSPLCNAYNNCSGNKYVAATGVLCGNNAYKLASGFAAYTSVKWWLLDYIRIISLSRYGKILQSVSLADFVNCLWRGGYFGVTYPNGTETAQNYYNGCRHYYQYYQNLFTSKSQGLL